MSLASREIHLVQHAAALGPARYAVPLESLDLVRGGPGRDELRRPEARFVRRGAIAPRVLVVSWQTAELVAERSPLRELND